jgi:methyltransferase OMS1
MENPVQVLREAQRVCKEDGKILLLEHGRSSWNWLANYMNKNAHKHATNWGCWYNRDILKIVQEAGLDIISVKRKHFGTTYFITAKPGPEYRSSEGTSNASFNHEAN